MTQQDIIESPCINNCCLDDDDICLGCKRSLQEIISWVYLDREERIEVLENCEQRKADFKK